MRLIIGSGNRQLLTALYLNESIEESEVGFLIFTEFVRVFEAACPLQRLILALHLLHEVAWVRHRQIEAVNLLSVVLVRYVLLNCRMHRALGQLKRTVSHCSFLLIDN